MLPKLHIPGPVDIAPETYAAMAQPSIGHRGADFEELYRTLQPALRHIAMTGRPVCLSTSSAWGMMEGALRNLCRKKVLNLCCGAFSDKWHSVALANGKEAAKVQAEWGQPIDPAAVRAALAEDDYDLVTLVHSETSTGVLNPLAEIAAAVRESSHALLVVDTVSSFSALPIEPEKLGIDLMLAGVQKALALPPGLTLFTANERALARAESIPDRGYYFDLLEFHKNHEKNNTPTTPTIPHIRALLERAGHILTEGLEARHARHAATNRMLYDWGARHGIRPFPPEGFRTPTLACFRTPGDLDLKEFISTLRAKHGILINGGYGKIKGTTFRVSNMGNETPETIAALIQSLDASL